MKNMYRFVLALALLCCAALNGAVGKDEKVVKVTYPDFPEARHLHGPKISGEELLDKVVFFEYWGINCPPCIASMPHLQELQNKYGDKGFTVVGSHCQGLNDSVGKFLKEKRITFPVYQQARIEKANVNGGLPHAVLLAPGGKVVAQGYPGDLYKLVKKEVDKISKGYPILEGMELEKYKALEKVVLSKGINIEAKIEPLRKKTDDEEAQEVCRVFDEWLTGARVAAQNKLENDPMAGISAVMELKATAPSVTEFDEDLKKLRANRDLPKLAALSKKVKDLEDKKVKRGKVNENELKSVVKELEGYASSDDTVTAGIASRLKEAADALAPSGDE